MNKLQAIVNYLSDVQGMEVTSVKVSEWNENCFEVEADCEDMEFLVLDDEEADEEFREYQQETIDDMGIEGFSEWAQEHVKDNFVDREWFEEAMKESYEYYCDDIENEEADDEDFENRLKQEISENGCSTKEEYVEYLCSTQGDAIEWYIDNFGNESFNQVIEEQDLINWDDVIEWVKETDGRGALASYDGDEEEYEDLYIYRTN